MSEKTETIVKANKFTILTWVVPPLLMILSFISFLCAPNLIPEGSSDSVGMVVMGDYLTKGIIVALSACLGLGVTACVKKEPNWGATLIPIMFSIFGLILLLSWLYG